MKIFASSVLKLNIPKVTCTPKKNWGSSISLSTHKAETIINNQ